MMPASVSEGSASEGVGARLKRLRLQRGLSQRDLSSPGVSYAYISRIEAGARTPSVKALRKLAQKLEVSVDYLETGKDIREVDDRELRLADAELELRLGENTGDAERKLSDLLDEAVAAGDLSSATRARLALGLAAASRGNNLDAVERLEAVVDSAQVTPMSRPDVYATLGQSYAALGAPDRSVRLFEGCMSKLGDAEHATTRVWFATLLSYALTDAGDYDRARDIIRNALSGAEPNVDPNTRVRLYWSKARLAGIEGRSAEALESIREAIALLKTTDDTLHLGRAYLMSAGIAATERDVETARTHLDNAEQLLGPVAQPVDRAMVSTGRARIAMLEDDGDATVEHARRAIDVLGTSQPAEQGAAVWVLAQGLALQGEVDPAVDAYRRAVDLLSVHGQRYHAGVAALEWADLLKEHGRGDEAEPVLRRAYDLGVDAEAKASRTR